VLLYQLPLIFCAHNSRTPLHLLVNIGHVLTTDGRKSLNREDRQLGCCTTITQDLEKTLEVLVTSGGDVALEDQYSRTAFHAYTEPASSFSWLAQESEWDIKSLSYDDYMSILACQNFHYTTNSGEVCRQLATTQTLQTIAHARWGNLFLLHALIFGWFWDAQDEPPSRISCEDLIMDTIYAGADLHSVAYGECTPLLSLLDLIEKQPVDIGIVQKWLELLNRAGADLVEYGRIENEMHDTQVIEWTFWYDAENNDRHKNECCFELKELRIGENPEDLHIEFEDLYVSTPLAADFWDWVEAPSIEEKIKAIPGSWKDDCAK